MKRFKNHAKLSQSIVRGVLAICFATITMHAQLQLVSAAGQLPPVLEAQPPGLSQPGEEIPGPFTPIPCGYPQLEIVDPIEFIPFDPPELGPNPETELGPEELQEVDLGPIVELGPEGLPEVPIAFPVGLGLEGLQAADAGPIYELVPCWPSNPAPTTHNLFLPFVNR